MPAKRTTKPAKPAKPAPKATRAKPAQVATAPRDKLTDKQRAFVEAYFACGLNGTEAAMQVYDCKDRSVAQATASRALSNVKVRAFVNERLEEFQLTANEVLARLAAHARGTIEDFIDANSGAIDMRAAKRARQLHLVKRYKTKFTTFTDKEGGETETIEVELELYDAQAALVHIGKHLNLFQADSNINVNLTQLSDEELRLLAEGKRVREAVVIK